MSQLIYSSKNSTASQSKQHEVCDFSYSFSIHVLNEAHDFSAVRTQQSTLIHSIFLILLQFYLITVLLLFHSILSCASCILLSSRTATFFKRDICYRYSTVTASSQSGLQFMHQPDIYISSQLHSFQKIHFLHIHTLSFHVIIKFQNLLMSILCIERCIETFLCYFYNIHETI